MTIEQHADPKQQALLAFERDLPKLWTERPGQWVAYHGKEQIGFSTRKHELYQICMQRGLPSEDFVIFCIEPQETEMTLGPILMD